MSAPSARDAAARACEILDARLERNIAAPLAVAFSGGGDSLALLLIAQAWAARAGRRLLVLTVDHQLSPSGAAWTRWCADRSARLGLAHRALIWTDPKRGAGVPAAARAARHRLLAQAARDAGARVILMGHTADDVAETSLMRAGGSSVPAPREWAPSPIWPEGRDIFLLRPLLRARRAALRADLLAQGEGWIDDPANADTSSARIRAREALGVGALPAHGSDSRGTAVANVAARFGPAGDIAIDAEVLETLPEGGARAFFGAALLCAAGTGRPGRGDRVVSLLRRIRAREIFAATLAGARIDGEGSVVRLAAELSDRRRGPSADLSLPAGTAVVWEGRYEVRADRPGFSIGPLYGRTSLLGREQARAARSASISARRAMPMMLANGDVWLPTLEGRPGVSVRPLGPSRLAAATGCILSESSAARMAEFPARP